MRIPVHKKSNQGLVLQELNVSSSADERVHALLLNLEIHVKSEDIVCWHFGKDAICHSVEHKSSVSFSPRVLLDPC